MFDALYIAATGMQAQQLGIDTIANNLANVNTAGFKKTRVNFTDLMNAGPAALPFPGISPITGASMADPIAATQQIGIGVAVASMPTMFDQGTLNTTGSVWDVAIQGDGFFAVTMPDGSTEYTRGGTLQVNGDGLLATQTGLPLKPNIQVPANAAQLAVGADGTVTALLPNQSKPAMLGQLQMARFSNASGLSAQNGNLFRSNDASGEPIAGTGGQDGIGTVQQGALEGSNVTMVDEMVNLMVAQRGYEASVKVVQAADEMLGMVNNLRK